MATSMHRTPPEQRCPTYRVSDGATHGKRATYSMGCRCDDSRTAWREIRLVKERARRARIRREREAANA